jgi:hypothetical protein
MTNTTNAVDTPTQTMTVVVACSLTQASARLNMVFSLKGAFQDADSGRTLAQHQVGQGPYHRVEFIR